ncbi:MAG: CPBP family intramembrane glutamic endopeptidase [Acutalibacteraceae bacterium]
MDKELDSKKIVLTLIGFIILWTIITDAWGYSKFIFNNNVGTYIYGYISRFIWILPAIFLIIRYNNKLKFKKDELFSRPVLNKSLIITITISLVYIVIMMIINHKGFWFNSEIILWLVIIKYIIVGFVEEVVFRGWGYNSLANTMSHKKAMIITTLLFILLHFPSYFIKILRFGTFDFIGIIGQSISSLVWGIVFCILLKKSKTIWNPIIVHTIYDLMYVLLVGGI